MVFIASPMDVNVRAARKVYSNFAQVSLT